MDIENNQEVVKIGEIDEFKELKEVLFKYLHNKTDKYDFDNFWKLDKFIMFKELIDNLDRLSGNHITCISILIFIFTGKYKKYKEILAEEEEKKKQEIEKKRLKENKDSEYRIPKILFGEMDDFDISNKAKRFCRIKKLKYLGDLIGLREKYLETNMGKHSFIYIKGIVTALGIGFGFSIKNWPAKKKLKATQ